MTYSEDKTMVIYIKLDTLSSQSYEWIVPGQVNWNFLLVLREMGRWTSQAWYFHSSVYQNCWMSDKLV